MRFHSVYYIISGWPSIEKTEMMVDRYVEHGVTALQFDMPAKDPSRESDFIKERMMHARSLYEGCGVYMDMMRRVRAKHPKLEMHLVVYPEIVDEIGIDDFVAFCKEIDFYSVLASSVDKMKYFASQGLPIATVIGYDMPDAMVETARMGNNLIVNLLNRNPKVRPKPGLETWEQRIKYLREQGVKAPIFGNGFIKTVEALEEVKKAGADGAYIGSILMQQWDNEDRLWKLLDAFQSVAE